MQFTPVSDADKNNGYDPSNVPPALRKSVARANKALKMMSEGKDPNDPKNWETPQPSDDPQRPQETRPSDQPGTEAPKGEPPATGQSGEPQAPPAQPQEAGDAGWEQRYRSLEGMYREQSRVNQGLQGEIAQLRGMIQRIEKTPQAEAPLPGGQSGKVDMTALVTDAEREEWGPEMTEFLGKFAERLTGPLQNRINQLEGRTSDITQREQMSARDTMLKRLRDAGIDVDELNHHADWQEWLTRTDEGSGQTFRDLIQNAWDRHEGARVEFLTRRFLREMRNAEPKAQTPQTTSGRAAAPRGKSLEDIAAPGRAKGTETPKAGDDAVQPETFTAKQFGDFFREKALGRLKLTPDEIRSWEERLNTAYREGRIQPTP